MRSLYAALFVGLMALAAPHAADAAVVIVSQDTNTPPPEYDTPLATSTTGVVFQDVSGSVDGIRRSPYQYPGSSNEDTALYTSVSGGASATYDFGQVYSGLQLLLGSPDTYNTITFLLGAATVGTFTGAAFIPAAGAGTEGLAFVNILFGGDFDTVIFASTQNALEFAFNPVPIPAALPLFAGGVGLLGWLARRKRRAAEGLAA